MKITLAAKAGDTLLDKMRNIEYLIVDTLSSDPGAGIYEKTVQEACICLNFYPMHWHLKPVAPRDIKYVIIQSPNCVLHPFGTVWEVDKEDSESYRILSRSMDKIPASWCSELPPDFIESDCFKDAYGHLHKDKSSIFGHITTPAGMPLNFFRKEGYYSDGTRTGKFTIEEYKHYEAFNRRLNSINTLIQEI